MREKITISVSSKARQLIADGAAREGLTVSAYIVRLAIADAEAQGAEFSLEEENELL